MAKPTQRLFLLDGMALVYRAHFALIRKPILNSKRQNTSAIFGFTNTLLDIVQNHSATHIGVAFDTKEPTPRHRIFPDYKAHRDAMPEDLAAAIPEVKRLIRAFNIPVIEQAGYEADDIIGTLAQRADAAGDYQTFMVTPDKDFAQLVSPTASIWKPGRKGSEVEILGVEEVLANWEIERIEQVIDILALWGDAADNIPGVPGIGEKTAKKLVAKYGSVEGLLEHADELKGKQKEKVEQNREQALLSKELVRIILDVPVSVGLEELKIGQRNDAEVKSLFTEWEFNAIGKRLYGGSFSAGRGHTTVVDSADELVQADLKTIKDCKKSYTLVTQRSALEEMLGKLAKQDLFCFDLETTSLNPREAKLLGVAVSWQADQGYFVSVSGELSEGEIYQSLADIFCSNKTKIGHNLKYDLAVLYSAGCSVSGPYFDTMLAHSLTHPEQRHNLDFVSESILGYTPIKLAEIAMPAASEDDDLFSHAAKKKASQELDLSAIPVERLCQYACEDADVTFQLAAVLADLLEQVGQQDVFYDLESPLLPVLTRMENAGIRIDEDALGTIRLTLAQKIEELQCQITAQAGREFNLNSPKQLGAILFDELALVDQPKKTKTGQYKTDESTLSALAPQHEIVANILAYRESTKLKSTYVDALPSHQCPSDGRIHSSFHQLLTSTGRLASSNPNIQNIPVRTDAGKEIRKAFIASEGCTLFSADYSQVELRVMASIACDKNMIEAFQQGLDIHTATAARVYGVALEDTTDEMRRTAKMVNFGIIYGISPFGLSQRLGIARSEAASIIETYFKQYPSIKDFMDRTIEQAHSDGYVTTLTGRKRMLRDINSRNANIRNAAERAAINTPIQGSAADMIKLAMIRVDRILAEKRCRTQMLLQVHDELIFDLVLEEQQELPELLVEAMQLALILPNGVPLKVDSGFGSNWLEAH